MSGNEAGCRDVLRPSGVAGDEVEALAEDLRIRRRLLDTVLLPVGAGWAGLPGVVAPTGVLFHGPDATLARPLVGAIAAAFEVASVTLDVLEVLADPGVSTPGEVAGALVRAVGPGPAVIELVGVDQVTRRRYVRSDADADGGADGDVVGAELLAAGLSELRGDDPRHQPLLVTTSERPWDVDDALLTRGAFDRGVFVAPPDWGRRRRILAERFGEMDGLDQVAVATDGWSVADLHRLADGVPGADVDAEGLLATIVSGDPGAERWMSRAREMADFASDRRRFDDLIGYLGRYRLG